MDSLSPHDSFLAEVYVEVLKVSIAAYVCMQTPEGTDAADFACFLQEQFKIREALKDRLFKVFQQQKSESKQLEEENNQLDKGGVEDENQIETLIDMYTFKAEMFHRSGTTEQPLSTLSRMNDFVLLIGNFFGSPCMQEQDVHLGNLEKLSKLDRVTAGTKKFIQLSVDTLFEELNQEHRTAQMAARIWDIFSRILGLDYRRSFHAYAVNKSALECFSKRLASADEDLRRNLVPILQQRLIVTVLKEVEFDLHQSNVESCGHNSFAINRNIIGHLWLLLNFLKHFNCLTCNICMVKDLCRQLDDLLSRLETETSATPAKATGCRLLLFLLRSRLINLTQNK